VSDIKPIEDALAEAKEALKSEDMDKIRRAVETLTKASHRLAEVMYRQAKEKQAPGTPPDAGEPQAKSGAPPRARSWTPSSRTWQGKEIAACAGRIVRRRRHEASNRASDKGVRYGGGEMGSIPGPRFNPGSDEQTVRADPFPFAWEEGDRYDLDAGRGHLRNGRYDSHEGRTPGVAREDIQIQIDGNTLTSRASGGSPGTSRRRAICGSSGRTAAFTVPSPCRPPSSRRTCVPS